MSHARLKFSAPEVVEKNSSQTTHQVTHHAKQVNFQLLTPSKSCSGSMMLNQAEAMEAGGALASALDKVVIGRFDSMTSQITSAYSRIVRSVENFAIDVAASMLNLHHFCLSAYVASTLFCASI